MNRHLKIIFLLLIIIVLSECKLGKKSHKEYKKFYTSSDTGCTNQCKSIMRITSDVKECGTFSLSCCAGTCSFGWCTGTRLTIDCSYY